MILYIFCYLLNKLFMDCIRVVGKKVVLHADLRNALTEMLCL